MWDKISCRTEGVRHITKSLQNNNLRPWRMLISTLELEWVIAPRKPQSLPSRKSWMEIKIFYTRVFCKSWKPVNVYPLPWHIVLFCLRIKLYGIDNMRLVNSLRRAYKWWDEPFLIAQVQMAMLSCCVCLCLFVCLLVYIPISQVFFRNNCIYEDMLKFLCNFLFVQNEEQSEHLFFLFQLWNTEGKRAEKDAKLPKQIIGNWDL